MERARTLRAAIVAAEFGKQSHYRLIAGSQRCSGRSALGRPETGAHLFRRTDCSPRLFRAGLRPGSTVAERRAICCTRVAVPTPSGSNEHAGPFPCWASTCGLEGRTRRVVRLCTSLCAAHVRLRGHCADCPGSPNASRASRPDADGSSRGRPGGLEHGSLAHPGPAASRDRRGGLRGSAVSAGRPYAGRDPHRRRRFWRDPLQACSSNLAQPAAETEYPVRLDCVRDISCASWRPVDYRHICNPRAFRARGHLLSFGRLRVWRRARGSATSATSAGTHALDFS